MEPVEIKVIRILERIRDFYPNGIRESSLPNSDILAMHRLTERKFIKATDVLETGEGIFSITEEGHKEAQRRRSH